MFALRLALAMGRPDVDAMLDGITLRQYHEWAMFFGLDAETNKITDPGQIQTMLEAMANK